jgi:hypothetical protein
MPLLLMVVQELTKKFPCFLFLIDGQGGKFAQRLFHLCRYLRGESLAGIGKAFDISSYRTVSSIIERFKVRMQSDRKLLKKVEAARETFMRQGLT